MKTNLLLFDSYRNMEDLVAYAFSLSNRTKRSLKMVYVFDFNWMRESFMLGSAGPLDPAIIAVENNAKKDFKVAEAKMREVAADYIKKHPVKIPFEIQVTEQNRIDVVQSELDRTSDLMLLIPNHQSYTEASGGLVGYPNLIEQVTCPVFVIPENFRHAVLKKVVYATDFHPDDIPSIKHLFGLIGKPEDTGLTILHNEKEYGFDEKLRWMGFREVLKEETGAKNLQFCLESQKDMVSAIEEFDGESDPDLLVILREKKGFFEEMFMKSETKNVMTHFNKPVLVYHEN